MEDIQLVIRRARRGGETRLNLSNKQLSEIPSEVFQLGFLQELDLSNNNLSSISSNIAQLPLLKKLNLSYNSIDKIPKEIQNMDLDELVLDGNPCEIQKSSTQGSLNSGMAQFNKQPSYEYSKEQVPRNQTSGSRNQQFISQQQNLPGNTKFEKTQQTQVSNKIQQLEQQLEILQSILAKKQYPRLDVKLNDIDFLEQISQGGFSTVHRAVWRGTEVVVKKIFDPIVTQELLADLENEVTMMNYLRHPYTLLLIGASTQPPDLFIITEYCQNKSLYEVLHLKKVKLSHKQKMKILFEAAVAINFYHESGVAHRDLKSHNVLLNEFFSVRLCDFGLTKFQSELNTGTQQFSGTPAYMAPEIFQKRAYDSSVDVFSFGTLIWETIAGQIPYDGLDPGDIKNRVCIGEPLPSTSYFNLDRLIAKCRATEAKERPKFSEILTILSNE